MAIRPSAVIGLIWHHPIVSLVVVLLFTPPLFPVVVYFSPLLISTALFVLAMISMESDHANDPSPHSSDIPCSRGFWIEEVELEGPLLDGERVPKRLKASSRDESWFDKVKNWEGTGRAWVDSVLSQEARKSFDDSTFSQGESVPLLDKTKGLLLEDVRKRSRDDGLKSGKLADEAQATVGSNDSKPSLPVEKPDSEDDPARPVPEGSGKPTGDIISDSVPDLESEDELIEITPASIPASPLFRKKSLLKANVTHTVVKDLSVRSKASPTEGASKASDLGGSVAGASEAGETARRADSVNVKDSSTPVTEEKLVECATVDVENSRSGEGLATLKHVAKESKSVAKDTAQSSGGEIMAENAGVHSGSNQTIENERNVAEKVEAKATTDDETEKSGFQPKETKSAAELLVPLRQGPGSYGLGTPSAAVALSEKLKVPLEDIMSLLAGDCKENASSAGSAGVEASSSSEITTSQEEEWSSSDVESIAPATTTRGPETVEKDP